MFASVRRYEGVIDPGEAGRRVSDRLVPLLNEINGFVAYHFVDAGSA